MSQAYLMDYPISWAEIHRDARALSLRLLEQGPWQGIIAITRGGLIPAAIVARELDIRLIDTLCVVSYQADTEGEEARTQSQLRVLKEAAGDGREMLIIDDLVDTGTTARVVRERLPLAHFATLYAKPAGRPLVDTYITEVSQDTWIRFPWDMEYQFARPLASQ